MFELVFIKVAPSHKAWYLNHPAWNHFWTWARLMNQNRGHNERNNWHSRWSSALLSQQSVRTYPFICKTRVSSNGASSLADGGTTWSSSVNKNIIDKWTVVMKLILLDVRRNVRLEKIFSTEKIFPNIRQIFGYDGDNTNTKSH